MVGAWDKDCVVSAHAMVANQSVHDGLVESVPHVQRTGHIGGWKLNDKRLALVRVGGCNMPAAGKITFAFPLRIPVRFTLLWFEAFGELIGIVLAGIYGHRVRMRTGCRIRRSE